MYKITAQNGTPINFQNQFANWRGTISATGSLNNTIGSFNGTFTGQGSDTSQASMFFVNPTFSSGFQSAAPVFSSSFESVINGLFENVSDNGAGGTVPTWTTGTAYVAGNLVQYNGVEWGATSSGTSTGSTGPTGDGGVLPGYGDQREVELLVEAGFTPVEAIKIATLNGATFEGLAGSIGSITPGKDADLVVVNGDPSKHIEDIEKTEIVFKDGVGYDSQKLLDSAKGRYGQY